MNWVIILILLHHTQCWVPPGLNSHREEPAPPELQQEATHHGHRPMHDSGNQIHGEDGNEEHHDHKKEDVAEMILDKEHISDDFGELYQEEDIKKMDLEEQLFLWFKAHDWDEDDLMDGLELLKALSHEHNYHHPEEHEDHNEEVIDGVDQDQHTPAADRQRLRRTVSIVDKILEDNDVDIDGYISFTEFYNSFKAGNMEGLKTKKT